jgi:NTE family protein
MPLAIIATTSAPGERGRDPQRQPHLAMRASMSVPGLIAPVLREGASSSDGGLTDNLPIAEGARLCEADVLIAVNVGSPLFKPDEVKGVVDGARAGGEPAHRAERRALDGGLQAGDIYIRPSCGTSPSTEFTAPDRAPRCAGAPRRGGRRAEAPRAPPRAYAAWQDSVRSPPRSPPIIDQVAIEATRFVNRDTIRRGISPEGGRAPRLRRARTDLVREFDHGDLHSLDYNVVRERDRTILRITPVEKPWGPNYLRFGLNLASDFRSESTYNCRALCRSTWMNRLGGEWLLGAQIGSEQSAATEFYQPLDKRHTCSCARIADRARRRRRSTSRATASRSTACSRPRRPRGRREPGRPRPGDARAGSSGARRGARHRARRFLNLTERVGGPTRGRSRSTPTTSRTFPTRGVKLDVTHFDAQRVTSGGQVLALGGAVRGGVLVRRLGVLGGLEGGTALQGRCRSATPSRSAARAACGLRGRPARGPGYTFGRARGAVPLELRHAALRSRADRRGERRGRAHDQAITRRRSRAGSAPSAPTSPRARRSVPIYVGVADAKNGKGRSIFNPGDEPGTP